MRFNDGQSFFCQFHNFDKQLDLDRGKPHQRNRNGGKQSTIPRKHDRDFQSCANVDCDRRRLHWSRLWYDFEQRIICCAS